MPDFNAIAIPATAVAQNGTFTTAYPTGTTAGSYAAYGHKMYADGLMKQFTQDAGQLSVSFGATTITVTYKGATSLPVNKLIRMQYHAAGEIPGFIGTIVPPTMKRMAKASTFLVDLGTPALAVTNGVSASQSVAAGAAFLLNGSLLSGGVMSFDVPRNVVAAWTTTSVLSITGTDEYGVTIHESSASGASHTGKKAFKTITSITSSASITSATVGTGVLLGFPVYVDKIARILGEYQSGVLIGGNKDKVYLTANVPLTDGTYAVVQSPVAGTITRIKAIVQGVFTTNNAVLTFKNNTTAITTGVITELVASVAVGDTYSVSPSAANTVAVDDKIMVVVTGTPGASKTTQVVIEIIPTGTINGAFVAGDQTVPAATTGDVRGTYSPLTAPDGTLYWSVLMALPDPYYTGATQF